MSNGDMKMGAGGSAAGAFELCPAGPQQLVCCDVIDHGLVMAPGFGNQPAREVHKISLRWMSQYKMKDGRPYIVQKRYTLSSHKKATLRQDLEKWRGRMFTDAEAASFELTRLIGVNCFANIIHLQKPRGMFAEIVSLMPPMPQLPKLIVDPQYVRVKDKPKDGPGAPPAQPGPRSAAGPQQPAPAQQPDPFGDEPHQPTTHEREPGDESENEPPDPFA
jgi:hypothetical protein